MWWSHDETGLSEQSTDGCIASITAEHAAAAETGVHERGTRGSKRGLQVRRGCMSVRQSDVLDSSLALAPGATSADNDGADTAEE